MRLHIFPAPALVHFDIFIAIDWKWTVRIDGHQKETRICLSMVSWSFMELRQSETNINQIGLIPHVQIVNH